MESRAAEIRAEVLAENEAMGLFPPSEQYLQLAVTCRLEMEEDPAYASLWGAPLVAQLDDYLEDSIDKSEPADAFAPSSLEFAQGEPSVFYGHEGGTVYEGQEFAKRRLTRFIETLDATDRLKCFLIGPAGTGKTALAKIIAKRIVARWEALQLEPGPYFSLIPSALGSADILDRFMIQLSELPRAIVFIDEVHDLGASIKPERLFRVLDDTGSGNPYITASGLEIQIPDTICWITATTDPGRLDGLNGGPLLRRIRPMIELERPDVNILANILAARNMPSTEEARTMMAERADGLPWKAIEIYTNARAEALLNGADEITPDHVLIACSDMGIDENGLESADRRIILGLLNQPRYKGSEDLICSLAGVDKSFFRSEIKPRLISRGYLTVHGGQMLTEVGARAYGSPEFLAKYLEDTGQVK